MRFAEKIFLSGIDYLRVVFLSCWKKRLKAKTQANNTMNKIKATKNEMRKNYRILSVGYCAMQYMLAYRSPVAYSSGAYGWNCDYYYVNGVIISTGYRPIPSKNVACTYAMIREYESRAEKEHTREGVERVLSEFIEKIAEVQK